MIGYVTLGTNDLPRAAAYYDALLDELGAKRLMETERYIFWGVSMQQPSLCVIKPFDGEPAAIGNGNLVALVVDARDKVDRLHAKALALGGSASSAPFRPSAASVASTRAGAGTGAGVGAAAAPALPPVAACACTVGLMGDRLCSGATVAPGTLRNGARWTGGGGPSDSGSAPVTIGDHCP